MALGLMVVTVLLMYLDHQAWLPDPVRGALAEINTPFYALIDTPASWWRSASVFFISRQQLIAQKQQLQQQVLILEAQLHKLLALEQDNKQLRALLAIKPAVAERVLGAQLRTAMLAPYSHKVLINRGSNDGIYVGQPVLAANGVLGQVVQVGAASSQVLLISDPRNAIPVIDKRSGVRAIVKGTGSASQLQLLNLPTTSDVVAGDTLLTSGLAGRYPYGYPVGTVMQVIKSPGAAFSVIDVQPSVTLNKERWVLLVWPH